MISERRQAGAYRVVAHLRRGGMADLYLARRIGVAGFRRLVAIKVIHPNLAQDHASVEMFVQEALTSARIDHPNVVHVEDLGEVGGTYFLVMEYIHGGSLAQILSRLSEQKKRLAPEVAVAIAARIAEGLHAAHETTDEEGNLLGLVHRDVSPQNILLSHKGHVKLIDFGVAKATYDSDRSAVATLKGKIRYMSPEHAEIRPLDRRSDIYSLGIVLWEMLTMHRPFEGSNVLTLLEQARKPRISPPARYARDIPPELDAVVMQALAPMPEDRPRDAKDFRRDLVRAFPRAATIDSVHLADLLVNVLGDDLDHMRENFPDEVSRVLAAEQNRVVELLHDRKRADIEPSFPTLDGNTRTMTITFDTAQFSVDELDAPQEFDDMDTDERVSSAGSEPPPGRTLPGKPSKLQITGQEEGEGDDETEVRIPTIVRILQSLEQREGPALQDDTGTITQPRRGEVSPKVQAPLASPGPAVVAPDSWEASLRPPRGVLAGLAVGAVLIIVAVLAFLMMR